MKDVGMTIQLLETFRDRNMWKEGFMAHEDNRKTRIHICENAIETIKEQQAEIKRLTELLKEKEPKVIELLDLYDSEGMQGYIETRKSIRPCFLIHHLQYPAWCYKPGTPGVNLHKMGIMDTSSFKRFWEFRLYNKTWRIWTAKPTEEQRKDVPWDTH